LVYNELEKIRKVTGMAYFAVLCRDLSRYAKENHGKPYSGYPVT
jgi:hypothetical protein